MSARAGISIEVDGNPTDLADVSWAQVAPCGCVCGLTMAWLPSPYGDGDAVITAEQAARAFSDSAKVREQDARRGFTYRPALLSDSRELMKGCEHEPKYGYERPQPDGYSWALSSRWATARELLHLVPTEGADCNGPAEYVMPLCGGKKSVTWTTDSPWLMDRADCERCIKKAGAR